VVPKLVKNIFLFFVAFHGRLSSLSRGTKNALNMMQSLEARKYL
jgi:hypothetical protein